MKLRCVHSFSVVVVAARQPAHPDWVRSEVDDVLARHGGAASRSALVARVGRAVFDHEVRRGELTAIFPRVYCRSWLADDCAVQQIAAVRSCGALSLLSHITALARYGLAEAVPGQPIHVTSNAPRHPRGVPDRLVVHRTRSALVRSLATGLPTTGLAEALVQSWPLLRGAEQRAPLIRASRQRIILPIEVSAHLDLHPKLAGRSRLAELLRLLGKGCESELELWGYQAVFNRPEFRHARWQLPLSTRHGSFRVDLAFEAERLAVELDGRAYHAGREQWERDIRRDLALAMLGWQTIRLSHHRLTADVPGCRRDLAAVLRTRRSI
jgi:very-short-patch-repair endonuclease